MRIHRVCIPLVMLGLCQATWAQEPLPDVAKEIAREKAFLPVYTRYIEAINTQGMDGLQTLLASNFTLKWDHDSWAGTKAVTELKKYMNPKRDKAILTAVKLRRLTFLGDKAIVQTEETAQFPVGDNSSNKMTASWNWKQTWRKMPEGWRLILWEQGVDKLPPAAVAFSYTVTWTPKSPNPASIPPAPSGKGSNN